ncbi:MAG: hypothetical protein R3321_06175 [Nitrososphaeraceae archaeon]|nr:hypothetical protein [Nitrososphaeraceae archaeon]
MEIWQNSKLRIKEWVTIENIQINSDYNGGCLKLDISVDIKRELYGMTLSNRTLETVRISVR